MNIARSLFDHHSLISILFPLMETERPRDENIYAMREELGLFHSMVRSLDSDQIRKQPQVETKTTCNELIKQQTKVISFFENEDTIFVRRPRIAPRSRPSSFLRFPAFLSTSRRNHQSLPHYRIRRSMA